MAEGFHGEAREGGGRGWRFGAFELDAEAQLLLEEGQRVPLTRQPLQVLALLVGRAGQVVSREQLREALWPAGTHVDFEAGLYTCMRRLRVALKDRGATPRYIETISGQGYRFVAAVEPLAAAPVAPRRRRARWAWVAGGALAAALATGGALWPRGAARVLRVSAVTSDGGLELNIEPARDGSGWYYLERAGSSWQLVRNGGEPATAQLVSGPYAHMRVFGISPDGRQALLGAITAMDEPLELWRGPWPAGAATPQPVGRLRVHDAAWYPDGRHIVYSDAGGLWRAQADGSRAERLSPQFTDASWFGFSADGRLRFTAAGPGGDRIFEQRAGGTPAMVDLGGGGARCCGAWSRDGRYYLYSAEAQGHWSLWSEREAWPRGRPQQLLEAARNVRGVAAGPGNTFVYYQNDLKEEAQAYDPRAGRGTVLLGGRSAIQLEYDRAGTRVVYLDLRDNGVWIWDRGTARKLSAPGEVAAFPRWSPDGAAVAYGTSPARGRRRLMVVSAAGGAERELTPGGAWAGDDPATPDWSPDGRRLAAGLTDARGRERIATVEVASGAWTPWPGAEDMELPRWSPDGRYLATISTDQRRLMVYGFSSQHWQVVATGVALTAPVWSRRGDDLYSQDLLAAGEPVFRLAAGTWKRSPVAEFEGLLAGGIHRAGFMELAPGGGLLMALNRGFSDLYAAELQLP